MTAGRAQSLRWGLCFALALGFHAAGAAALLAKWTESSDLTANPPIVMLDLATAAVAPETAPNDVTPDRILSREQEPEPEPEPVKPIEKVELPPPQVQPEVTLPPPPPKVVQKPKEQKKPDKKKSVAHAPSAAPQRAEQAAAPSPGAGSRDPNALQSWRSQLVARLERYKRYPSEARGDSGTAQVAFRVDRSGGVHNVRIARSSGSSLLDHETLALLDRAQPMPPPPPGAGEADLSVVAPVRYNAR
jgi:protein TonB